MSFLDIGPLEILLILVIALIIWGPGKIPDIAKTLGRTVNALRKASFDLTTQIKNELDVDVKEQAPQSKAGNGVKTSELPDKGTKESSEGKTPSPADQSDNYEI